MKKFPRLIIAATQSGAGKTTIVAGILSALKNRGLKVQPYKVGPDYIDTGFHKIASGKSAHNLDSWLVGEERLADIFFETFADADIAIVEGVMGLYDGGRNGISSTAQVAKILNAPVILVIDAKSMGASAAALAFGFRDFDKDLNFAGVILNRIGSESHKQMIQNALDKLNIKCFGAIERNAEFFLPERHLGLVPTAENNFNAVIEKISASVEKNLNLDELLKIANVQAKKITRLQDKKFAEKFLKIAVAQDEAFNFYYAESLRELEKLGAEIIYFSPLHDNFLPEVDGLILGGGFPEMFASQLEKNISMRQSIKNFSKPIYAECGGYMYLMKSITDFAGKNFEMCGVIDNSAIMTKKLQTVGYVSATLTKNCIIGAVGDKIHAHEFHFSVEEKNLQQNIFDCEKLRTGKKYFAGWANENICASYLHLHFAGCPTVAENFINACKKSRTQL